LNALRTIQAAPIALPDSLYKIPVPTSQSFAAQAAYINTYWPFIATQWSAIDQYRAQLLSERYEMSGGVLPEETRVRPKVSVPIIGLALTLDDVTVMGASLLTAMMLWVFFLTAQLRESIRVCKGACGARWGEVSDFLRLQFLLLAPRSRQPHSLAYPMVFLPYIAVMVGIAVDLGYDLQWQNAFYATLMGVPGATWQAFVGHDNPWKSEAVGLLTVRYVTMLLMAGGLLVLSTRVWRAMSDVAAELRQGQTFLHVVVYIMRIIVMTAVPFVVVFGLYMGRMAHLPYWVEHSGYTSGPSAAGAFWAIGGLVAAVAMVSLYWRFERWFVSKLPEEER
jgi:hypothetical protein